MLTAHYRSPINFSDELLEQAKSALNRIYECRDNMLFYFSNSENEGTDEAVLEKLRQYKTKFIQAMEDDLNTADALGAIFELVREINTIIALQVPPGKGTVEKAYELLAELTGVLGILSRKHENNIDEEVEGLIEERQKARAEKNYKRADEIRDLLNKMGFEIQDTPMGLKWFRKPPVTSKKRNVPD